MTPKEKADELVNSFARFSYTKKRDAKQCALICVEEIISAIDNLQYNRKTDFWEECKSELEKL